MDCSEILSRLREVQETGSGWQCRCPAHEDNKASLSVSIGEGDRTLLKCHAGCTTNDICKAIGITVRDLFTVEKCAKIAARKPRGAIVAEYDYRDESGKLLYQAVRMEPKDFRQRTPLEGGKWEWKLNGARRVPYRLPDLLASAATVFVVEGEKDADRLAAIGLTATSNVGGAGKWQAEYAEFLRGRQVVILPDNDDPGRKHASQVAKSLVGLAESVKIIELPDLPAKGDVSDWLDAGGTVETLLQMVEGADEWTPGADKAPEVIEAEDDPHRLARIYLANRCQHPEGLTLRYWRGEFQRYRGAYRPMQPEDIRAELNDTVKAEFDRLNIEAQRIITQDEDEGPPKARKVSNRLISDVRAALESMTLVNGYIEQPTWLDGPAIYPADEILAAPNALVHLPSLVEGKPATSPPTPRFFTANAIDYDFNLEAPRPEHWLHFLAQLWPDDPQSIEMLQEWFGYSLTPDTRQEKILLVVGPKRSGKGTIARVLRRVVGEANCCGPTLSGLGTNFGLWPLLGKSLAIISDARLSHRTDTAVVVERLLAISGEDGITVDRKNLQPVTCKLSTRFMLLTNELPRLADASGAIASRFIVLQMSESFYGREDHGLTDRLYSELPGILLWSIEGWRRLRERGAFVQPESSSELAQEMDDLSSPIRAFIRERCELGPFEVERTDLFEAWKAWCEGMGRDHVGDQAGFGQKLHAAVPTIRSTRPRKGFERVRCYQGIKLS